MQVNRHSSTPQFDQTAVPAPEPAQPNSSRDNRRAVKKIASSIDSDLKKLDREGYYSTNIEKLSRIRDRVLANQTQLALLSAQGLDRSVPPQSALRLARSAVVLGSGVVARGGAIIGASVAGIAEGGGMAAVLPVAGTIDGVAFGVMRGARVCGGYTSPVTVPIGAALGAAAGVVYGTVAAVIVAPDRVVSKGSLTRNTFSLLDPYAKAKAHVARKSMSTQDIADAAALKATDTLEIAEEQCKEANCIINGSIVFRVPRRSP